MSDAKRLLDEATPLPWSQRTNKHPQLDGRPWGWIQNNTGISSWPGHTGITWGGNGEKNAALIVYAVNRLPDYEALADAAERLSLARGRFNSASIGYQPEAQMAALRRDVDHAQSVLSAALRRVRQAVPA